MFVEVFFLPLWHRHNSVNIVLKNTGPGKLCTHTKGDFDSNSGYEIVMDMDTNILSTSKKSEPNISGLGAIYLTF